LFPIKANTYNLTVKGMTQLGCPYRYSPLRRFLSTIVVPLWIFPVPTSFGFLLSTSLVVRTSSSSSISAFDNDMDDPRRATDHYRSDGVRITHDPYAPGMASKYGLPGETDPEGFVSTMPPHPTENIILHGVLFLIFFFF